MFFTVRHALFVQAAEGGNEEAMGSSFQDIELGERKTVNLRLTKS